MAGVPSPSREPRPCVVAAARPAARRASTAAAPRAIVLLIALLLLLAAPVGAQSGPVLSLEGPDRPVPGDVVVVTATDLASTAIHTVRVDAPSGQRSLTMQRPEGGRIVVEVELREPGRYEIWLIGPDLEARFVVPVVEAEQPAPAEPAPTPPTPAPPAPAEPTPAPAEPAPAPPAPAEPTPAPAEPTPAPPAPAEPTPAPPAPAEPTPAPAEPAPEPTPTEPAAPEPTPAPALAPDGPVTLAFEVNEVWALEEDGETVRWRLGFPPAGGTVETALQHLGRVWVALGHQVLTLDPADGRVLARVATSGRVTELRPVGTGLSVVSEVAAPGARLRVEARLEDGVLTPPALFDPDSVAFDALAREADVGDPAARLALDRTNPFLFLQAATAAPTEAEREAEAAAAVAAGRTFYDLARLARGFAERGWWTDADAAMAAAAADFAARGYDPALLTSVEVHERYGFPLLPLQRALMRADANAADLWAPWLYALSGPDLRGVGTELRAYATSLGARGDRIGEAEWRQRASARSNPSAAEVVARTALLLGRGGIVAGLALLVAFVVLHLTLIAKYARAQALAQRQAREAGRRVPRFGAFRTVRFYGLTEKLVLLLLLASAYATIALVGWAQRGEGLAAAAAAGHLRAPTAAAVWSAAQGDPADRAWVTAYLADRAGDPATAHATLVRAERTYGDGAAGRGSLERARAAVEAGAPIPTPSPATLRSAAAGTWTTAVADAFRRPWGLLDDHLVLLGLPAWTWPAQLVIFWLVFLWHVVALVVPRPRYAREAPRTLGYHVLALLAPGTGQADELYGILLLLPWAIFGIDAGVQLIGGASPLGIPFRAGATVLVVLYVVNAIAWAIEYASVRKRLERLRVTQPELARAFGLTPAPVKPELPEPT
jgi:hypothetical protein